MFHFEIDRLKMQKALHSLLFASFFIASGTSRRVEMKFDDGIMLHISTREFYREFSHCCREAEQEELNAMSTALKSWVIKKIYIGVSRSRAYLISVSCRYCSSS